MTCLNVLKKIRVVRVSFPEALAEKDQNTPKKAVVNRRETTSGIAARPNRNQSNQLFCLNFGDTHATAR